MKKVYVINTPSEERMTIEGRCAQKESTWSSVMPPYSLASVSAIFRRGGFDVKSIDCRVEDIDKETLLELLSAEGVDIVVINSSIPTFEFDVEFVRDLREKCKNLLIIVFGIMPPQGERAFLEAGGSSVIKGEPEFGAEEIAKTIINGGEVEKTYSGMTKDLDGLPHPAWDLFDLSKYTILGEGFKRARYLFVVPARGCPFNCSFCNAFVYYGKEVRYRTVKSVVDEIEDDINEFGIVNFAMWTETFTFNRKYVSDLCDEIIKRKLKIDWISNSRVDRVDKELLEKMKEAGCWMVSFGVESGSQEILNKAHKGTAIEDSITAIRTANEVGLITVAHTIIGLVGETEKTSWETLKILNDAKVDFAQFYCAVPMPETELYKEAVKNNWIKAGAKWSEFEQTVSIMDLPGFDHERVMKVRKRIYLRYYLNPCRLLRIIRKSGMGSLIPIAREGINFVGSILKR